MSATPPNHIFDEEPTPAPATESSTAAADASSSSSTSQEGGEAKPFVQPTLFSNKANAEEAQANRNASILALMMMNICTQKNLRVLKQKVAESLEVSLKESDYVRLLTNTLQQQ